MINLDDKILKTIKISISLSNRAFNKYVAKSNNSAERLGILLVNDGIISRSFAGKVIADAIDKAYVELATTSFQGKLFNMVPNEYFLRLNCIPIYSIGSTITLASNDPLNEKLILNLEKELDTSVNLIFSFGDEIRYFLYKNNTSILFNKTCDALCSNSNDRIHFQEELCRSLSNYLITW